MDHIDDFLAFLIGMCYAVDGDTVFVAQPSTEFANNRINLVRVLMVVLKPFYSWERKFGLFEVSHFAAGNIPLKIVATQTQYTLTSMYSLLGGQLYGICEGDIEKEQ